MPFLPFSPRVAAAFVASFLAYQSYGASVPTFTSPPLQFSTAEQTNLITVSASRVVGDLARPGRDLHVPIDFDGNGSVDIAQVDRETRVVTIRRRLTTGTGEESADYGSNSFTLNYQPTSAAIDDLNNDGRPDFAFAMNGDISVVFNQGLDTSDPQNQDPALVFAPSVAVSDLNTTLTYLSSVVACDVNDDGLIDLLATGDLGDGLGGNTARVAVFLNGGPASGYVFGAPTFYELPPVAGQSASYAGELAVGDLNGDERPDIATLDTAGQSVRILLNASGFGFDAAVSYSTGAQRPAAIVIGDVSRDDRRDIVTMGYHTDASAADATQSSIVIGLNVANGQGGFGVFQPQTPYHFNTTPQATTVEAEGDIAIAPVNADEFADIVVVDSVGGKAVVLVATPELDAQAAFTGFAIEKTEFATAAGARRIGLGDLNTDLKFELLTGQPTAVNGNLNQLSVLFNTSTFTVTPASSRIVFSKNGGLNLMDPDGSNAVDLTGSEYAGSAGALNTDGTLVAFVGLEYASGLTKLYVMKAEPAGAANVPVGIVTGSDVLFNYRPTWSPDGKRLVYVAQRDGSDHLYLINAVDDAGLITPQDASTNPSVKLTTGTAFNSDPVFAPNGRQLLFCRLNSKIQLLTILNGVGAVTPESTTNPAVQLNLTQTSVQSNRPTWAPDGSKIVFVDRNVATDPATAKLSSLTIRDSNEALTVESATNPRVALTAAEAIPEVDYPSISQDGNQLVFSRRGSDNMLNIFSMLPLAEGAGNPSQPLTSSVENGGYEPAFAQAVGNGEPTVAPAPSIHAAASLSVKIAGKAVKTGKVGVEWKFIAVQKLDKTAPGLALKVQYSTTPNIGASWVDLPNGAMSRATSTAITWVLAVKDLPLGSDMHYRVLTSATGFTSAHGTAVGPYTVLPAPILRFSVTYNSASDSTGATTHRDEVLRYFLKVENTGSAVAENVVLRFDVPTGTELVYAQNTRTLIPASVSLSQVRTVEWRFASLAIGQSVQKEANLEVDSAVPLHRIIKLKSTSVKADAVPLTKGPVLSSEVLSPLGITIESLTNVVSPGGLLEYTLHVKNYAGYEMREAKVSNRLPKGTTFESARENSGSGNFNGTQTPLIGPSTNPSITPFSFIEQQVLTWNLGTIPIGGEREIRYTLRAQYDLASTVLIGPNQFQTNQVVNFDFNAQATPPSGGFVYALDKKDTRHPGVSLVSAANGAALPQIGFVKHAKGLGAGGGMLRIPGLGSVATVLPNGQIEYVLRYFNTGGSLAKRCVIVEEIAAGAEFLGFLSIDGNDSNPQRYAFYDSKMRRLPLAGHTLLQDIKLTRVIEFLVGDVPAGGVGEVSYRCAASSPPPAEVATPPGKFIASREYSMFTESLSKPVRGEPAQVPVKVVKPISFEIETRPDKFEVAPGEILEYTITFQNNGGVAASNVVVSSDIPPGTSFVSAQFLDSNYEPTDGEIVVAPDFKSLAYKVGVLNAQPETGQDIFSGGTVRLRVQVNNPLPLALRRPDTLLKHKATIKGTYQNGSATGMRHRMLAGPIPGDEGKDEASTRIKDPLRTHLWALKTSPQFVKQGEKMLYAIAYGNSGNIPVHNVRVAITIPYGTEFLAADSSPGAKLSGGNVIWDTGDLAAHGFGGRNFVVRIKPKSVYKNDLLIENSCYVDSMAGAGKLANAPGVVPGPSRTLVLSSNPAVSSWQWFGAQLQALGANILGKGSSQIEAGVTNVNGGSVYTTMWGIDVITLNNGAFIIQNGGGQIVAGGAGNIISGGAGNIISGGAGNIIAAGAGNIISGGAGNLINVASVGLCTQTNMFNTIQGIISGGAGNIIAAGAGNIISSDGASLIAQDGSTFLVNGQPFLIDPKGPGIISGGGGNIVAGGAGNIVSAGAGNIISGGAGNFTENLISSKPGVVTVANPNGIISGGGGNIISGGAGNIISNDGASIIASDGASLLTE